MLVFDVTRAYDTQHTCLQYELYIRTVQYVCIILISVDLDAYVRTEGHTCMSRRHHMLHGTRKRISHKENREHCAAPSAIHKHIYIDTWSLVNIFIISIEIVQRLDFPCYQKAEVNKAALR